MILLIVDADIKRKNQGDDTKPYRCFHTPVILILPVPSGAGRPLNFAQTDILKTPTMNMSIGFWDHHHPD